MYVFPASEVDGAAVGNTLHLIYDIFATLFSNFVHFRPYL